MQATLRVTKKLTVTPLIDIQHPVFAGTYSKGLQWAMHGDYQGEKPLPDSYLDEPDSWWEEDSHESNLSDVSPA